jgi:hypothetical protein
MNCQLGHVNGKPKVMEKSAPSIPRWTDLSAQPVKAGPHAVFVRRSRCGEVGSPCSEGRKIRKSTFSARLIPLSSFRWASDRGAQSKPAKVHQTDVVGSTAVQTACKYFIMNGLKIIRVQSRSDLFRPIPTKIITPKITLTRQIL